MSHSSRKARASALNQPDLFAFADETRTVSAAPVAELHRQAALEDKSVPLQAPDATARLIRQDQSAERAIADCQGVDVVGPADVDQRLIEYVASGARRGRPLKRLSNETVNTGAERLLDVREAARRLGLSKSTLDKMRCSGRGPRFIRATERAVRYDPADLDAFANERRRRSTSEEALSALRG
jgi:predicted DNA-binding transcriptional regulator AlpA